MYIKEGHAHRDYHGDGDNSGNETGHKKERATELTEDGHHKSHIAAESHNTWISHRQLIEIHHLVKPVHKEQDTKEESEGKNQKRNSLPYETRGKKKIVKPRSLF